MTHREGIDPTVPPSGEGCVECLAGDGPGWWFHLRRCALCGHVGCCDSSPSQHATRHHRGSGHPIVRSFEPGEDWFWSYPRQAMVPGEPLAPPVHRPLDQPVPGPRGKVPSDWRARLHHPARSSTAHETRGVAVKLLATVDLGPEIEGMAGRQLRMRLVTIEPGGVFGPVHDHKDRPGTVYVLQGTITDHRDGASRDYGPGPGWPEDRNTSHWLENRGAIPAVEISVDIVRQG